MTNTEIRSYYANNPSQTTLSTLSQITGKSVAELKRIIFGEDKSPSNISDFIESFNKDVARPCNFDVSIFPTNAMFALDLIGAAGIGGENPKEAWNKIKFHCDSAELPSRTFTAVPQKTYGPETLHPIQTSYNKMNLTFICSDTMLEKWIFDYWMNYISNASFFPFQLGLTAVKDLFLGNGLAVNYDFKYRNMYEALIVITQYSVTMKPSYYVGLFHAFPIAVNAMPLSWSNGNAIHRLSVTFAYTYFNSAIPLGGGEIPFPIPA